VSFRHKVLETCPQRQTRVTPIIFRSTVKSTLPNDTVASPYRSSTSLFSCITAQWPLCPQRHFRYQQVQTALTPVDHCVPSDTLLLTIRYKRLYADCDGVPSDTSSSASVSLLYCVVASATRKYILTIKWFNRSTNSGIQVTVTRGSINLCCFRL